MNTEPSMIQRLFSHNPRLRYLSEKNKYLTKMPVISVTCVIIGVGVNGQEHLRNTLFEGRATVKGVYDLEPLSIAAAEKDFKTLFPDKELVVYDSIHSACSDPEVDAIIISTPNYTHIEVIREVVKYKKHILLEKPMATTVKDAWEIMKIAESYPSVFQIGLQYRYKSIYTEAIYEAKERCSIGNIKTISISEYRVPFLDKVNQWNKFSKYSGGTLVEKCCHYFDLFNLFADSKPMTVFASGSQAVNYKDFSYEGKPSDILDNATVIVEYENGVRANFNLCMFAPMFYEELVLCGDQGRISAHEKQDFLSSEGVQSHMQVHTSSGLPARDMVPKYPFEIENLGHNGATFFEHIQFINNILHLPTDSATVSEGFWSVVVGAAAQESIMRREPVQVQEYLKACGIDITK